jgi:hypothetical protein
MGAKDRLLVVPTDTPHLEVVEPAERARRGRGDATVHQDQLEPSVGSLLGQVLQHQLAGTVLMCGSRYNQRPDREPGDVDGHHALRALRAAVGAPAVVKGEPAVRCPARSGCR